MRCPTSSALDPIDVTLEVQQVGGCGSSEAVTVEGGGVHSTALHHCFGSFCKSF